MRTKEGTGNTVADRAGRSGREHRALGGSRKSGQIEIQTRAVIINQGVLAPWGARRSSEECPEVRRDQRCEEGSAGSGLTLPGKSYSPNAWAF